MNNKIEVIGIDHGWSNIKTSSQVFVTGVKEITTEPALFDGVLEYKGRYYKVGGNRQEVKSTKTEDDTFYLLTLAAVAKELRRRGLCEAKVFLAVGLPLTRFGSEKSDFVKYLTAERDIEFLFENIKYHVVIENVAVAGDSFFRPHRAYLVNFKYVEKYDATTIYLEKGTALMAKQNYPDFVKKYMKYNQRKG